MKPIKISLPGWYHSCFKSSKRSIVGITIILLGMMIGVMALMIGAGLGGFIIILFMALMFLMLLGIDGLFLWQLSRLKTQVKEAAGAVRVGGTENELGAKREQFLAAPGMSVTERTTRVLTYEERKRK